MRLTWLILVTVIELLCCASLSMAAPHATAVLVTFEGVSLDQIVEWKIPEIEAMLSSSAIGLMNDRGIGKQTSANNVVTIGAGTRASGTRVDTGGASINDAMLGFNWDESVGAERAGAVLAQNTGIRVGNGSVVQIGIESLGTINSDQHSTIIPGLLGSQLQSDGVDVSVYGNSDQGPLLSRQDVAIAMNRDGVVPGGDVGARTLTNDADRPFGSRTNYDYLFDRIISNRHGREFVVVEAGDGGQNRGDTAIPNGKPM